MGIWDSIRISLIGNFLFFGSIMLWMLVVQPIFLRIKYSVLCTKLKKLDERLKSEGRKMDLNESIRTKLKCLELRYHLGIGIDEDLLLVRPPTVQSLMMEGWRHILISKEGLLVLFLICLISTTLALFF